MGSDQVEDDERTLQYASEYWMKYAGHLWNVARYRRLRTHLKTLISDANLALVWKCTSLPTISMSDDLVA